MAVGIALSARSAAGIVFLQLGARHRGGSTKAPPASHARPRSPRHCICFGFLAHSLVFISFPSVLFLFSNCRPGWMPSIHPAALDRGAQTAGACSLDSAAHSPPGSRRYPGSRDSGTMAGSGGAAGGAAPGWGGRRARLKDREWEEVWV